MRLGRMTDLTLNDGRSLPQLGFGTYKLADPQAAMVVRRALDIGYRLIDTAAIYDNERGVGDGVKASDAFVTTKLWNDRQGDPAAALDESLALLGRDAVDLYLIHWPSPAQGLFVEAWKALVGLRDAGKARSIGVSNFLPEHLDAIIDATGVTPAVNQIELHPHHQRRAERAYHEAHGIVTQSWSPLGQGGELLQDDTIGRIAAAHGRSPAQVVLAWHLAHGLSPIPKAADSDHMSDNFAALDLELAADELAAIDGLDRQARIGPDPLTF